MVGIRAFLVVLLMMPLGHALMVATNRFAGDHLFTAVALITILGTSLLLATRWMRSTGWQSAAGALAGVFLWTGLVEYGFLFGAEAIGVGALEGTRGEYRIMQHTWGLLAMLMVYLLFHEGVRCPFFVWIRRACRLTRGVTVSGRVTNYGPRVAFEMVALLWLGYVALLGLYDKGLAGEHHPVTYAFFLACMGAGIWMLERLARIRDAGYAIRYAIPTVIVVWNCVELTSRWGVFQEPWVTLDPVIMGLIGAGFALGTTLVVRDLTRHHPVKGRKPAHKRPIAST